MFAAGLTRKAAPSACTRRFRNPRRSRSPPEDENAVTVYGSGACRFKAAFAGVCFDRLVAGPPRLLFLALVERAAVHERFRSESDHTAARPMAQRRRAGARSP